MKSFESGIRYYTWGYAVVENPFPEDVVCCEHCKFFNRYARQCKLDEDVVIFRPDKFVGGGCPMILKEEN